MKFFQSLTEPDIACDECEEKEAAAAAITKKKKILRGGNTVPLINNDPISVTNERKNRGVVVFAN